MRPLYFAIGTALLATASGSPAIAQTTTSQVLTAVCHERAFRLHGQPGTDFDAAAGIGIGGTNADATAPASVRQVTDVTPSVLAPTGEPDLYRQEFDRCINGG